MKQTIDEVVNSMTTGQFKNRAKRLAQRDRFSVALYATEERSPEDEKL